MSLINDALKQARQAPPRIPQRPLPSLPPDDDEPGARKVWARPSATDWRKKVAKWQWLT